MQLSVHHFSIPSTSWQGGRIWHDTSPSSFGLVVLFIVVVVLVNVLLEAEVVESSSLLLNEKKNAIKRFERNPKSDCDDQIKKNVKSGTKIEAKIETKIETKLKPIIGKELKSLKRILKSPFRKGR